MPPESNKKTNRFIQIQMYLLVFKKKSSQKKVIHISAMQQLHFSAHSEVGTTKKKCHSHNIGIKHYKQSESL